MINFKNLLLVSAAALAFGACSSNETLELTPEVDNTGFDSEGNGYINIAINLPSGGAGSTRADAFTNNSENDQTSDGEASEYEVKNAMLILFTNTEDNELSASVAAAYDLGLTYSANSNSPTGAWSADVDDDQITIQATNAQKITDDGKAYKYVLVVLNKNDIISVDNTKNKLKVGGTEFTGTFQQLSQHIVADGKFNQSGSGFFMTNAVLTTSSGNKAITAGAAKTSTLVNISNNIYKSKEEAEKAPAVDVIVERAVAKVQLTSSISSTTTGLSGVNTNDATISTGSTPVLKFASSNYIQWKLTNKNAISYLVRNWNQTPYTAADASDNTKFSNAYNNNLTIYGDGASSGNNTGWFCLHSDGDGFTGDALPKALSSSDTKYNAYRFVGYNPIKITTSTITNVGTNPTTDYYRTYWCVDPNYNTTLPSGQETNAAITESSYSNLKDNNNNTITKYCLENTFDVAHQTHENTTHAMIKVTYDVNGDTEGTPDFYVINSQKNNVYDETNLENKIKASSVIKGKSITTGTTITIKYKKKDAGSTASEYVLKDAPAGTLVISSVSWETNNSLKPEELTSLNAEFNIDKYAKGVAYYPVMIKHFGDDLTPWNRSTKTTLAYPAGSEGTSADNRWLGRYGVVRNNWYLLNVSSISEIGYPEEPTPDETTDDDIQAWISVRASVLSWAKRFQDIKL